MITLKINGIIHIYPMRRQIGSRFDVSYVESRFKVRNIETFQCWPGYFYSVSGQPSCHDNLVDHVGGCMLSDIEHFLIIAT